MSKDLRNSLIQCRHSYFWNGGSDGLYHGIIISIHLASMDFFYYRSIFFLIWSYSLNNCVHTEELMFHRDLKCFSHWTPWSKLKITNVHIQSWRKHVFDLFYFWKYYWKQQLEMFGLIITTVNIIIKHRWLVSNPVCS